MKVLLSAYACEPGRGSEPGVGWRWALEISRLGHDVWALTRANNQSGIEAALVTMAPIGNLQFLYYDLPAWARWWKKGARGIYLYNLLWQWGAYRLAKKAHANIAFDRVHHITFGVIRQPSFMGSLGVPFLFGPVGGGERAPWALRWGFGVRGWLLDAIRDLSNWAIRFDPMMRQTFRRAEIILVKTPESQSIVPRRFWPKTRCQLEIGIESLIDVPRIRTGETRSSSIRILYVGRFIYWKGMHLGLAAFALLLKVHPTARLTMVGNGPEEARWRKQAENLNISGNVDWISWVKQEELSSIYHDHDLFLFPSLHDSSGNVVLEALVQGLPVVCLDVGGPATIVNGKCGVLVATGGKSESEVAEALAKALKEAASSAQKLQELESGALIRARQYSWSRQVEKLYFASGK